MTTLTPNLNLILYNSTTDQAATFAAFRADIAGISGTSNFSLIDTAYGTLEGRVDTLELIKSAILINANFISSNYYEATTSLMTAYTTGMSILLNLDTDSAGTVTLKINALTTLNVMKINSTGTPVNMSSGELQAGRYYLFIYDGTRWVWADATSADQVYHGGATGNLVTVASDGSISSSVAPATQIATSIDSSTAKTTPVDDDKFGILDSAASYILKYATWSNIKTTLKTYFDTYYLAITNKATASEVSAGTDDSKYVTSLGIRTSINGNLPDGYGVNYTISSSVTSNDLTISLKGLDGNDPSSTNPILFRCGTSVISLTSALSITITDTMGDIFAWDARKIQGNDAQLFIYFINNNGTAQLGASPSPNLLTVATNYYDLVPNAQTGSAGFNNIVMSGTRNATNTCRVMGRLNVNQSDANNWQNPTTAKVVNTPIWNTDWLTWTPQHSRSGGAYTNLPSVSLAEYIIVNSDVQWRETHTQNATPGSSGNQTLTTPVTPAIGNIGVCENVTTPILMYSYSGATTATLTKYDGTAECTASNVYRLSGSFRV